ncbi:MAG: cell division protein ZapA [Caldimicrobium sp.]|nr:cell division protein ZapA [Caldimicrobium sp.]MCX7873232.1 cell division protein ZapA [Caldimicrobium sp.]MDW8094122.1 cell division protein ZapA [Caldimicrobium sp.]
MSTNQVTFEFLGQSFTFRSHLPEEDIEEVLNYLEGKKRELEALKKVPTYKLAIWLLLQVAYDYVKVKREKETLEATLRAQLVKLEEFLGKISSTSGARE